jgi:hypothetical protein
MDGNDAIELKLAEAERSVAIADRNVANQRAIIEELERGGNDVRGARLVLRELEETRGLYARDRDRLLKQLGR